MQWLVNWWDSVELWLVGLPFPAQAPIVLVVVVPLCLGVATVVDRGTELIVGRTPTLARVSISPRARITATLVGLLVLVVVAWLLGLR